MKINLLYLLLPLAAYGCYWIMTDLQGQSGQTFFATAESESRMLTYEHPVLVQSLRAEMGQQVKAGDTLAILFRSELDRSAAQRLADMTQIEAERTAKNTLFDQEKGVLLAKKAAQIADIQAQIKILQTEEAALANVKSSIYSDPAAASSQNLNVKRTQMAALEASIAPLEQQFAEQMRQIESQRAANQSVSAAKTNQLKGELGFIDMDRNKLALIAPMDGFIEQVFISKNALVPSYRDLIKINPRKPNKLIGFIHESANVPFQLGDSVILSSSTRLNIVTTGKIMGSSPKLVELPYRLRKFTEVRAWGREVYIQLPETNAFFIGEKISVTLPNTPPQ
jgi:multidrug resistance efflux pump